MDTMIPAAAYRRVSTDAQVEDGISLDSQKEEIDRWALSHGYRIVMDFCDAGKRGSDDQREEFVRMRHLATSRTPPFRAIIAWKSNRIARSVEIAAAFRGLLKRHGIDLLFVAEPSVDGPIGSLIAAILDGVNEFYSGQLGEDTLRGMRTCASRGFWQGGKPPYGFRVVEVEGGKALCPDTIEGAIVFDIHNLYAAGLGVNDIARQHNERGIPTRSGAAWTGSMVHHVLFRNREYNLGHMVFNRERKDKSGKRLYVKPRDEWTIANNTHEPIISPDMADAVDTAKHGRFCLRSLVNAEDKRALLVGVIRCGHCGYRMVRGHGHRTGNGRRLYYRCAQRIDAKNHGAGDDWCRAPMIHAEPIEETVLHLIRERYLSGDIAITPPDEPRHDENHAARRDEMTRRRDNLLRAIETGMVEWDEAKTRIDAIRREIARLDAEYEATRPREGKGHTVDLDMLRERLTTGENLRAVVTSTISRIDATKTRLDVSWLV